MNNNIFIVLLSSVLLLISCDAEIVQSRPSIQIETATPEIVVTPTREGAPNLAGKSIQLFILCTENGAEKIGSGSRINAFFDFASYVNKNEGIFGAEIAVEIIETTMKPEIPISEIESSLRINENDFLFLLCDEENEIYFAPIFDELSLIGIGPGLASAQTYLDSQKLFSSNPVPEAHFLFWMNVLEKQWEQIRPEGADTNIRLAVLSIDHAEPIQIDSESLSNENIEVVWRVEDDENITFDIFDIVYEIRDANSNAVYLDANGNFSADFINALYALGLRERFFVFGPSSSFESDFNTSLFDPSFASSASFSSAYAWWGATEGALAEEIIGSGIETSSLKNGAYLAGLQMIDLLLFAIEEAIIADSFENLSANNIAQVLDMIEKNELISGNSSSMLTATHTLNQLMAASFTENYLQSNSLTSFTEIPEMMPLSTEE